MAEIHVEPKKQSSNTNWIWIVLVLLIAAAAAYYFLTRNKTADTNTPPANTTGAVSQPADRGESVLQQHTALYIC